MHKFKDIILNYRLLLPLVLLCTSFSSRAEDRWFEIELLLFQRNTDINDISETLALKKIKVNTINSVPLLKTIDNQFCTAETQCLHQQNPVLINSALFDSENNGFELLDNSHLLLTEQREKLQQHAAFTPLLHVAWRMPVKSRSESKAIHLFAGENYGSLDTQATTTLTVDGIATETIPTNDKWAIDGNFKIYLEHYLFIDSQLIIRQKTTHANEYPIAQTNAQTIEIVNSENGVQVIKQAENTAGPNEQQETQIKEVLFSQNRLLRSGEIHYFDHPLMGMIVQIRKIPEQEILKQQASQQKIIAKLKKQQ